MTVDLFLISYNKAQWLREGIENALKQNDVRVVVIDNASSDNSVAIAREYPIEVWAEEKNLGFIEAAKKAIRASKADYLMICSSEDPLVPGIFAQMLAEFKKDDELEVVGTDYEIIDADGGHLRRYHCTYGPELYFYDSMPGHFLIKREAFKKVMWREVVIDGKNGYFDWDFWLQCLHQGTRVKVINKIGFKYRQHSSLTSDANIIRKKFKKKLREDFEKNAGKRILILLKMFFLNPQSMIMVAKESILKLGRVLGIIKFY